MLPISNKSGEFIPFIDAFFTATSATCVTGLVVVDTAVNYTLFGQIVILLLIQIGGLGFMTLTTLLFLIIGKKITLKERLLIQESLSQGSLQGLVKLTKGIFKLTLIIESIGAIILMIGFLLSGLPFAKSLYYGIFHSISAFCNAGFDVLGADYGAYVGMGAFSKNPLILMTLSILITFGGIGFIVVGDIIKAKKWSRLMLHTKIVLVVTATLTALSFVVFLFSEWNNPETIGTMNAGDKIFNCLFQAVTPRTAGFSTFNQASMSRQSQSFSMMMMFIGASPTSTGGGIKTTTLFILIVVAIANVKGKKEVIVDMQKISLPQIFKAVTIFISGIACVFCSTMILACTETHLEINNLKNLLFESISAYATVGLTLGVTPTLTVWGKLVISGTMFIGRVGAITISVAFAKQNMIKNNNLIKYPDAKIIAG